MFRPLSFLDIEPAVHLWLFHTLAPGSFWFLHINPWFLHRTPRTSSFLADRPLDLVLALDFTF